MRPPASPFPLRVGAIDVGSNAIRFLAAEFVARGRWVEIDDRRIPVRLGHHAFLDGRLDEDAITAAVEALCGFRRSIDALGLSGYAAVATSAVRESRNGGELVDRIRRACGIHLATISGREEARLVWLAARSRVPMGGRRWLLTDLGGGSLELALVSAEGVHWTASHEIGTVRLLETLGDSPDTDAAGFRARVTAHTEALRLPGHVEAQTPAGLIATGGNIDALADLAGVTTDELGTSRMPVPTLERWIETLSGMPVAERTERLGLDPDRADVILPAALLYRRVAELATATEIVVPHVGVKEGVLIDVADEILGEQPPGPRPPSSTP